MNFIYKRENLVIWIMKFEIFYKKYGNNVIVIDYRNKQHQTLVAFGI